MIAHWKERPRQFFLRQHMQHIRLVFGRIDAFEKLNPASGLGLQAHIVPGRHKVRAQGQRMVEQEFPADVPVAHQARVRRFAFGVTLQEV
jgi:hypothetical protein